MHKADTQCTLQGREEAQMGRKKFVFKSSCLALKYEFYFVTNRKQRKRCSRLLVIREMHIKPQNITTQLLE